MKALIRSALVWGSPNVNYAFDWALKINNLITALGKEDDPSIKAEVTTTAGDEETNKPRQFLL